jgi:hypothetical protein
MTIKHVKKGYALFSKKTGRRLNKKPKSYQAVRKQEAAIEISKAARARGFRG